MRMLIIVGLLRLNWVHLGWRLLILLCRGRLSCGWNGILILEARMWRRLLWMDGRRCTLTCGVGVWSLLRSVVGLDGTKWCSGRTSGAGALVLI